MTDNLCCNCKWYVGVHGIPGQAECKNKHKMVLWNECCDSLWLIPKRLKVGVKTNADIIRQMSDEELAKFLCDRTECHLCEADDYCTTKDDPSNGILKWLKQEAGNG